MIDIDFPYTHTDKFSYLCHSFQSSNYLDHYFLAWYHPFSPSLCI